MSYSKTIAEDEIKERLFFAKNIAIEAGRISLSFFRKKVEHSIKLDLTPVTEADEAVEKYLIDMIRSRFADDGILGEKSGDHGSIERAESTFKWIIDPIDGTTSFMRGIPFFSTLIGIQHNKKMVAGVMHFPASEETYYGSLSEGAYWDTPKERGRKIQVSSTQSVPSSSFVSTSVDYFRQSGRLDLFNRLSSTSGCTLSYPDAYAFALVASGRADYVVEPGVKALDIAAAKPIIEAAGGIFCDFTGKDSIYTGSAMASNRFLHGEILKTIQEF